MKPTETNTPISNTVAKSTGTPQPRRLAVVVTHPIQYYVPLYRLLTTRPDLAVKVFYTWHSGEQEAWDYGFGRSIAWDLPMRDGYDWELIPNTANNPGSNRFWGIRNPALARRVLDWTPDAVHVTGYAFASHLALLRRLAEEGIPSMFRGDSTLLTPRAFWKQQLKRLVLSRVFRYPAAFLYVGQHNRRYYEYYGVPETRLYYCPHSIDVGRFAEPADQREEEAQQWRASLNIDPEQIVLLFSGKFEEKKQPLALMELIADWPDNRVVLVMVGDGQLGPEVDTWANRYPQRFRVLPFQNQSRMPIVYRLGDLLVLPSSRWETWGLAVNEAFACGRPALVSDQVGCAPDLIVPGETGDVFSWNDRDGFRRKLLEMTESRERLRSMSAAVTSVAKRFSIAETESRLIVALNGIAGHHTVDVRSPAARD